MNRRLCVYRLLGVLCFWLVGSHAVWAHSEVENRAAQGLTPVVSATQLSCAEVLTIAQAQLPPPEYRHFAATVDDRECAAYFRGFTPSQVRAFFTVTEYVPVWNQRAHLPAEVWYMPDATERELERLLDAEFAETTNAESLGRWISHSWHKPSPHEQDYIYLIGLRHHHRPSSFNGTRSERLVLHEAPDRRQYRNVQYWGYRSEENEEGDFEEYTMWATMEHRHCYAGRCFGWKYTNRDSVCEADRHRHGSYRECHIHSSHGR